MKLYLLEPATPGAAWAPFASARPIAELRAGAWKIRERWEAAFDLDTTAILGTHVAGFHELDTPPILEGTVLDGPAIVADATFAVTGAPIAPAPGTRRLCHHGETVAWLVGSGERWEGPHEEGAAESVDGLRLRGCFDLVTALERFLPADCLGFGVGPSDPVPAGSLILGDPGLVHCRGTQVEPGVVFDTRHGAVVLDQAAEVRHGSRLEGPLYIGVGSQVLGGDLRHSALGPHCKVRGEVSHSLFLGYSNKSHEGFVGHSVVGQWTNLGALTTTSNLKNTYGDISLPDSAGGRLATGRQFLGSLIGDHVKTAIGTLLATGSVIGTGANLFGPAPPPRLVAPMAWGSQGTERMTAEGFLRVAERVMPRREVVVTPERRASLLATYRRLTGA